MCQRHDTPKWEKFKNPVEANLLSTGKAGLGGCKYPRGQRSAFYFGFRCGSGNGCSSPTTLTQGSGGVSGASFLKSGLPSRSVFSQRSQLAGYLVTTHCFCSPAQSRCSSCVLLSTGRLVETGFPVVFLRDLNVDSVESASQGCCVDA